MARSEHLNDEILALAAVDKSMLTREQKEHLDKCEACRETLAGIEAGLGRISQTARSVEAPPVPDMQSLTAKKSGTPFAYAAVAAVILVLAATWAFMPGTKPATMVATTETMDNRQVQNMVAATETGTNATTFQDYLLGETGTTDLVLGDMETTTDSQSDTEIADTFYEFATPMDSDNYLYTDLEDTTWS